jgi:hypothetical protein
MGLSLVGLVLSIVTHVLSWMNRVFLGEAIWGLHMAAIAMGVPAVLVSQALTRDFPYHDWWRAVYRGCPAWMRKAVGAFGIYAVVNFVVFFFVESSGGHVAERSTTPVVIRGFSGHWMFFYAAFFGIFFSTYIVSQRDPARRCPNGHPVGPSAVYCERCGQPIQGTPPPESVPGQANGAQLVGPKREGAMTEDEVIRLCDELSPSLEAVRCLEEFLQASPGSIRVKFRLAYLYSCDWGGGPTDALRLYREVLVEDPENVACLTAIGLLPQLPDLHLSAEERIDLLSRAADISGESLALQNLAYEAWDLDRRDKAKEAFERLLAVARARGEKHLVRNAKKALADLRKGRISNTSYYSIPDAWVVRRQ